MLEMFDPAVANPFRPTFSYLRSEAILETAAIMALLQKLIGSSIQSAQSCKAA